MQTIDVRKLYEKQYILHNQFIIFKLESALTIAGVDCDLCGNYKLYSSYAPEYDSIC